MRSTSSSEQAGHLRLVLWKANKSMEAVDRQRAEEADVCLSDFAVLEVLLNKGAMPVNAIGQKVLLTSGSITTAIDRLENRGLVQRDKSESDGRVYYVSLTPAGRALINELFQEHIARLDEACSDLSATEREQLITLLKKLGKSADRISFAD